MTRYRSPILLLAFLLGLPSLVRAQETPDPDPLVTDRPTFTQSAPTVARGRLVIEGGYTFSEQGEETSHTFGELGIRFGFATRWEARLSVNPLEYVQRTGDSEWEGPQEMEIGAKAEIIDEGRGAVPELSLFPYAVVPLDGGDRPIALPGVRAIAAWGLSDQVSMASNLGWLYDGTTDDRYSTFSGSLILALALDHRLGTFLEIYRFWPTGDRQATDFVNAGMTFLSSANVQWDIRVGSGLDGPWPAYFGGFGAAFRL